MLFFKETFKEDATTMSTYQAPPRFIFEVERSSRVLEEYEFLESFCFFFLFGSTSHVKNVELHACEVCWATCMRSVVCWATKVLPGIGCVYCHPICVPQALWCGLGWHTKDNGIYEYKCICKSPLHGCGDHSMHHAWWHAPVFVWNLVSSPWRCSLDIWHHAMHVESVRV